MKNRTIESSRYAFLGLALVALGAGHNGFVSQTASTPTPIPSPTATVVATEMMMHATPMPLSGSAVTATTVLSTTTPAPPPQGVSYQDDFTDAGSGWKNSVVFDNYYIGYHEPTYYHVEVHTSHDNAIVVIPKKTFADFTVEAKVFTDPNNTAPTGDFRYGLVFRRAGKQYYAFAISPRTNTWSALKSSPVGVIELKKGTNDSIQGLKTTDTLRVDARGSAFTLSINGKPISQISDPDYATGETGFYVETFDSPRAHIHYDTISVRELEAAVPAAAPAPSPGVLYQDDFTDAGSGWKNSVVFDNYYIGYHEPTYYHVEVHTSHDNAIVVIPKKTFADFTVEAKVFTDPNNTAPTGDFRYGLVFRRAGKQYYAFAISPRTNTWSALKSSPVGVIELKKGTNDSIQGLKAADTLLVDARGSAFTLSINGKPVGQFSDPDYAGGETGFYVETFDSPRAHIHYDTISVRKVEAQMPMCIVIVSGLNMRDGPGVGYKITNFAREGDRAEVLARSRDGGWLYVRINGSAQPVWISSAPIYVACTVSVNTLPARQP